MQLLATIAGLEHSALKLILWPLPTVLLPSFLLKISRSLSVGTSFCACCPTKLWSSTWADSGQCHKLWQKRTQFQAKTHNMLKLCFYVCGWWLSDLFRVSMCYFVCACVCARAHASVCLAVLFHGSASVNSPLSPFWCQNMNGFWYFTWTWYRDCWIDLSSFQSSAGSSGLWTISAGTKRIFTKLVTSQCLWCTKPAASKKD